MTDKETEYVAFGLVVFFIVVLLLAIGLSKQTTTPQQNYDNFIQMKADNQKWLDEQRNAVQKAEMDAQIRKLTH